MATSYEELDFQKTPLGDLVLRRRVSPGMQEAVYEILLGGAFLMSSLVNESERALATLALEARGEGPWRILVGGLGLGYTARAALEAPAVRSVTVVELLPEVIDWHERGILPLGPSLNDDARCRLVADDFFALVGEPPGGADDIYDVILLDIDHAPEALLRAAHGRFYDASGLERLRLHVAPNGVFALWAGHPADAQFVARLGKVFDAVRAEEIRFFNPHVNRDDVNTIYLARRMA